MNFRILHFVLQKRKVIGSIGILLAVITLVYLFVADAQYRSETLLMPPLKEGAEGLLSAWTAQLNLPSMIVPMAAGTTNAAVLVDILESRRLAEMIIMSLDLKERYKTDSMDQAIKQFRSNTSISVSATGMISLRIKDKDPEMAQRIVIACIAELDSLNHHLLFTRAENTMNFVSGQIEKYRGLLEASGNELVLFQTDHGIVDFEEQIRGAIDVATTLKIRSVLAEIELDLLREFSTDSAIDLQRKEMEFSNLSCQLEKLMVDDSTATVFFPLADMPRLYQRYAALQRDMQVNEKVYLFLVERYEESGIDRARNTPTIQIVDFPNIPEKPAGLPSWAIVVFVALAGWLWGSIMFAWWGWVSMRERDVEEEKAFRDVVELVRNDIVSLRRRLRI